MTLTASEIPQPPVGRIGLALARSRAARYAACAVLWTSWWAIPAAIGLVLQAIFDTIAGDAPVALGVPALVAVLLAVEATRVLLFIAAVVVWTRWWVHAGAMVRTNLLRAQLASGGPEAGVPVGSAGGALSSFRDDVDDLLLYVDGWLDLAGTVAFTVVAVIVMLRVDVTLTLVVVLPLAAVFVLARLLTERLRQARLEDREATAAITGYLGELFGAVLAVKVAGATPAAVQRLQGLNRSRRRTALRDKLLSDGLEALSGSTVDVCIGLVLLLTAAAMREGTFTIGDLALFASYLSALAGLPRWMGILLTRHRHAQVAARRLGRLLPDEDPTAAVAQRPLRLDDPPAPAPRPRLHRDAPADLRLEGFGVRREGGVSGVDLHLPAGSFTVVCGPVGSGKTTLLKGLLGLARPVEGTVRWNGEPVPDLAAHMVPPRCAYVPQVARLFSGTLRDNLTLGLDLPDGTLNAALRHAAFDGDVAEMTGGLSTVVGARGVRLSGGQLQRAATARALASGAAFLVLDDISSALDARTERALWDALLTDRRATVLVVSHRPAALARADQIVLLSEGEVQAVGTLTQLRAAGQDLLAGTGSDHV